MNSYIWIISEIEVLTGFPLFFFKYIFKRVALTLGMGVYTTIYIKIEGA